MNGRWSLTIPLAYLTTLLVGVVALIILEHQSIRAWWHQRSLEKIEKVTYQ